MTVDSVAPPAPATAVTLRVDPLRLGLAGIVVVQAVWLSVLIGRGWFLQSDFSNLAESVGRSLDWAYLRQPLGGHFDPIGRLAYWLLDRVGGLNYPLTIGVRVVFQAIATVLLYRIVTRLAGRTPINLVVVGLYAISPLLLPGLAWLTSGIGLVIGQAFVLWAIEVHLRNEAASRPQLTHALGVGVLLGVAALSADEWVVAVLLLPILSAGCVYSGPVADRLREFARRWPTWLLTAAPLAAAAVWLLVRGDKSDAHGLNLGDAYALVRDEWLKAVGPSLVGGHWHWFVPAPTYQGFYMPSDAAVLLGQLACAVLVIFGLARTGLRALVGWSLPAVTIIASMVLVGVGRYAFFGTLVALAPRYSFVIAAPLAMGVAVSLAPATGTVQRVRAETQQPQRGLLIAVILVTVAAANLYSGVQFSHYWAQNPAQGYVTTLLDSVRTADRSAPDGKVNIYDSGLPANIVPGIEPRHNVSDVLRLAGVAATYDDPGSEPLIAATDGHLVKSVFVPAATGTAQGTPGCGTYVQGVGSWTIPLSAQVAAQQWYLRFELVQKAPSSIDVELVDAAGHVAVPVRGSHVVLASTLAAITLALPTFAPVAVRVRSSSPQTNLCLARTLVGSPFPAGG